MSKPELVKQLEEKLAEKTAREDALRLTEDEKKQHQILLRRCEVAKFALADYYMNGQQLVEKWKSTVAAYEGWLTMVGEAKATTLRLPPDAVLDFNDQESRFIHTNSKEDDKKGNK